MATFETHHPLVSGLGFPESLRWRDGRLWYADWAAGTISRIGPGQTPEVRVTRASFPLCFDLLPDADGSRPVLVSTPDQAVLLAGAPEAEPTRYASLAGHGDHPWNEIVLAPDGSAYVNNIGFAYGEVDAGQAGAAGFVVLVRRDGSVERVADELAFPNGMAVIDAGRTLLVAESWGSGLTAYAITPDGRLTDRRVWAETPGLHPDGIDALADGTVWLADVGTRSCVRVAEGGTILDRLDLPQSAFDCVVGDLGAGPTLYVAVNTLSDDMGGGEMGGDEVGGGDPGTEPTGKILAMPLSVEI